MIRDAAAKQYGRVDAADSELVSSRDLKLADKCRDLNIKLSPSILRSIPVVQSGLSIEDASYNVAARLISRLALNNEEDEGRSGIRGTRTRVYVVDRNFAR